MSKINRLSSFLAVVAMAVALVPLAPANAAPSKPKPSALKGDTVTVETFLDDNETLVSTGTFGSETQGLVMGTDTPATGGVQPLGSGSGGSSSASGCTRVTVNNEGESPYLGTTVYWYHTWTRWCWNRSTQTVYDVSTGWYIDNVASFTHWAGEVNNELGFYDYSTNNGYPRSAYKHYRMGSFDNCPIRFGCVETLYPANTLRSYYNGTWAWSTSG